MKKALQVFERCHEFVSSSLGGFYHRRKIYRINKSCPDLNRPVVYFDQRLGAACSSVRTT